MEPSGTGWWGERWSLPVVAVVVAVVELVGTHYAAQRGGTALTPAGYGLLLVGPVALLGRTRWPAAVLVVTVASTVLFYGLGFPYGPVFLSMVVAVLGAVARGYRVLAWACAFGGLVAYFLLYLAVQRTWPGWTWATAHIEGVIGILVVAEAARFHRQRVARQRQARAELDRRQASEERLRIAQELHDVLAHNISLINVQAGVALHLMDRRPEQARTALATIKQASKEALNEMRSALAVLRGDRLAPRSPTPGLDRLDELTGRVESAGLPVRTTVSGAARALPVGVDFAAYRIVQEALTNVYRHAHAGEARVELGYEPDRLTVTVSDDGTGAEPEPDLADGGPGSRPKVPSPGRDASRESEPSESRAEEAGTTGSGSGIPGMRQRATALGGGLTAGSAPGGGFRVTAWFPLDEGVS
ncbi:MAG: sensor histidine kinase [Micromonosporaceae bacterium]|nr:sensor histidine kinase [Micromonosporaceae bacterium]